MNDDHESIERDFNAHEMKSRTAMLIVGALFLLFVLAFCATASAQTLQPPTRVSSYDWACLDASGAVLSPHQRFDTALFACLNNANGHEIVGGRYRINRPTSPPPDPQPPACPAKPADDSRAGVCPAGTTGSWTQTRTYSSAPSPICWQAGAWTPSSPPAGACVTVPAPLTAPTLAATQTPNVADPTRSNVTLTWTAVTGATSYEIERCTGATCTNFAPLATATVLAYANNNIPGGLTVRYRVRAVDASRQGEYSAVVSIATPAPPAAPTEPVAMLFLNAGGAADGPYLADQHFVGGTVTSACRRTMTGVFQTRRYSASSFEYRLPLANGTYVVRLLWQECWNTGLGQRVLSANVEGQAIPSFDTWRADGAVVMHERAVTLTDGVLNITLTAGVSEAMVNAIEVSQTGADPVPPPPPATGSVTLSWTPPTQNTDGSALTNLAGYRIVYGTSPGSLTRTVQVANPSLSSYVIGELSTGTWFFAARAYTSTGIESMQSNVAERVVP